MDIRKHLTEPMRLWHYYVLLAITGLTFVLCMRAIGALTARVVANEQTDALREEVRVLQERLDATEPPK